MALVLPTAQSAPTYPAQALTDATDLGAFASGLVGTGVLSGCAVSSAGGMSLTVAAGSIMVAGVDVPVSSQSVTVTAAAGTDRRDIVVVNGSGTASVVAGTACAVAGWTTPTQGLGPVKPAVPAGSVLVGSVYVPASAASLTSANVTDKTLPVAPVILGGNQRIASIANVFVGIGQVGDSVNRFSIGGGGRHNWGPGNASTDTNLYRNGVGILQTDATFAIGVTSGVGLDLSAGGKIKTAAGNETTSANAGANGAVPAQVVGYITFTDHGGTNRKIPYFAL